MNNLLSGIIQERIYMALFGCCLSIVSLNAATEIISKTNYENLQIKKKVHKIIRDQNSQPIIGVLKKDNASVSGTTENINSFISAAYTDKSGKVTSDDYTHTALSTRLQFDINI